MNQEHIMVIGNTVAAGNFGSPWQLLILLVIVLLLFGGNRLRNLGGDLGGALKGFKRAMGDAENKDKMTIKNCQNSLMQTQNWKELSIHKFL